MTRTPRAAVVRPEQLSALASPVRQELLDALARLGKASRAELAAATDRPADSLYYHVRALIKVGLVHPAGARTKGGRGEALVRAEAPQFALRYATSPPRTVRGLNAIVAGMLRLGIRDFRRALAAGATGAVRLEGPARDLRALRTIGWLTPAEVRAANRKIQALADAVSHPTATKGGARGRLYAITVLLTPVGRGARRAGRTRSAQ